ncbi:hypothetical protein Rsub_00931 [Raphidocelis subcapitata]|uniref:Uncharacterized protein n=1 Tax=Raphidocelis subcapitata TaxID=307507 RepID=A0A2V0NM37_9CHLO|nr:hypothetical protein Rsub_00931 [Raphidocelis subcapitata]|eukprot:GBF88219.1 hypothetical protein Rsub_00931 [Raphidocelis subcapitata]
MADAAASPGAAARERLAAALQGLGDALRLKAHQPEVQELISIWDLRSRAVLAAVDSAEGGLGGAAAAPVAAAADLLQLLPAFAAPGAEGVVEALIAAARREEGPARSNAFIILAELTRFDADAAERATSTDAGAALLALTVERMQSAAAPGAASSSTVAAAGLLVALASEEWAATREEVGDACEQLEAEILLALASLMAASPVCYTQAFEALTSRRGALPRVLALLRSPYPRARNAAGCCIAAIAGEKAGVDALFKMRRAAVELTAALGRAHAGGEDPALVQVPATFALAQLLDHSEGQRVTEAPARAAAAEGGAGSLLGALVGLIAASLDGGACPTGRWNMGVDAVFVLCHMISASTAEQLLLLRRAPRLAEVCVRAMHYWLTEASDEHMDLPMFLVYVVAVMAGFNAVHAHHPPAATADTAAARAALQGAPGLEGRLRRYLDWARRQPSAGTFVTNTVVAAKWLLKLPEVKPAAAATTAAPAVVAGAAVDPSTAPAPVAAAAPLPPRPAESEQPAEARACSSDGGADGRRGGSNGGSSGGSGSCTAAASRPYVCGNSAAEVNWRAQRAACRAARAAAAQLS